MVSCLGHPKPLKVLIDPSKIFKGFEYPSQIDRIFDVMKL